MKKPHILIAALALLASVFWSAPPALADEAEDLYFSANGLFNRGLYAVAEREYKAFLGKFGGHAKAKEARAALALCLAQQGKHAEAEPILAQLANDGGAPHRPRLALAWGAALAAADKSPEAEKAYALALGLAGGDAAIRDGALAGLTAALYRQGKWREAAQRAGELAANPQSAYAGWAQFQRGLANYQAGEFKAAAESLGKIVDGDGKSAVDPAAGFWLGESLRLAGDAAGAEQRLNQAVNLNGASKPDALLRLAMLHLAKGDPGAPDRAIQQVERLRREHAESAAAKASAGILAQAHLRKGDAAKAIAAAEPAAGADPEAAYWLARAYLHSNRAADAERISREALAKFASHARAASLRFELARALEAQSKFADAARAFAESAGAAGKESPLAAPAIIREAMAWQQAGDHAAALRACDRLRAEHPNSDEAKRAAFTAGESHFQLGQSDGALGQFDAFAKAFAADPQARVAEFRIGEIHYRAERWGDARSVFNALVAKNPAGDFFAELAYYQGDCAARQDDANAAIAALRPYVERNPPAANRAAALAKLGALYEKANNAGEATAMWRRLAEQHRDAPQEPRALAALGRLYYAQKNFGEAKRFLSELAARFAGEPERAEGEYYLGFIALEENAAAQAAKHFEEAANRGGKEPFAADARLQQGLALAKAGDHGGAAGALARYAAENHESPKLGTALYQLGASRAALQQWEPALNDLRQAAAAKGGEKIAAHALAQAAACARQLNREPDAAALYAEILDKHSSSEHAPAAALALGDLLVAEKKFDEALARLAPWVAKLTGPSLAAAQYRLGQCHAAKGNRAEAAKAFEAALNADPGGANAAAAAYQAGEARLGAKEYPQAAAHFAAALTKNPDPALRDQASLRQAECHGFADQWPQAEAAYAALLAANPEASLARRAQFGIGWAQENQGKRADAIASYQKVIAAGEKTETAARAQFQIGECHFAEDRLDDALLEFNKVASNYGSPEWSARALYEMGQVLAKKGDAAKAKAMFAEVIEKFPDSSVAAAAKERL